MSDQITLGFVAKSTFAGRGGPADRVGWADLVDQNVQNDAVRPVGANFFLPRVVGDVADVREIRVQKKNPTFFRNKIEKK